MPLDLQFAQGVKVTAHLRLWKWLESCADALASADVLTRVGQRENTVIMVAEERRRWQRLERELRVELRVLDSSAGKSILARGTHLSPTGIFVIMGDPPAEGTPVRITIRGDGGEEVLLSAEGVVTNQKAPDDHREETGVGIALTESGASWRKLYEWLSGGVTVSD